jgi:hypothetical protein
MRRIADQVVGRRVEQSLQQFVNQSPWRWDGVRRALAHRASAIRPRAWLVQEAIFPKNGGSSVGVAKQFAASAGRTLNCQLGLVVYLANGQHRCAVNWRLMIPKIWDGDDERRKRTRLPDDERHQPRWRHVLEAVVEMTAGWGLRPAPIVWDSVGEDPRALLRALTERRLSYIVRISPHAPVVAVKDDSGETRMLTAQELAALSVSRRQLLLRVPDRADGASIGVQYSTLSICDTCPPRERVHVTSACQHVGTRRILAEWSWAPGGARLRSVWVTDLASFRLPQLVSVVELSLRAGQEGLDSLRDDFGLLDFEGRSFAGWHHHVTLVSVAHAYRTLQSYADPAGDPANQVPARGNPVPVHEEFAMEGQSCRSTSWGRCRCRSMAGWSSRRLARRGRSSRCWRCAPGNW